MRFTTEQRYPGEPNAVATAYADPALYESFDGLTKLTKPEVLDHRAEGDRVVLRVRYGFGGSLSPAARAVLDPSRLTWVEETVHDLSRCNATFRLEPDHYADRLSCEGRYQISGTDGGAMREGVGDLRVRALLVGGAVEAAIVSGLREHLAEETRLVVAYLSGSTSA